MRVQIYERKGKKYLNKKLTLERKTFRTFPSISKTPEETLSYSIAL